MRRPAAPGTDEDPQEELAAITTDPKKSGEVVWSVRMQLANALTFVARVAPAAPEALDDRPVVSQLPRIFRVRSNTVEKLDFSTPDGYLTQARQLS